MDKMEELFMKATGIVRRIDDLGRVVIPKEIRKTLRISEGAPLEIFTDREGEIILKKYSPIRELGTYAKEYAEVLAQMTGNSVCIADHDQIIAAAGSLKKQYLHKQVSKELAEAITERNMGVYQKGSRENIRIVEGNGEESYGKVIYPVIAQGDAVGAVVLLSTSDKPGEIEEALTRCTAGFLGKQMEN